MMSFLKLFWKEILAVVALALLVYSLYDYGYDRGVAQAEAKYAAAVLKANDQAKKTEEGLKVQVQDLYRKLEITEQNIQGRIKNETTSANATISELTRRLRNSKCTSSVPEDRTAASILDFATVAAETANFNYGVGLKNANQVAGLQVYVADVIKACQNGNLSVQLQGMKQSAQERLKELTKIVEDTNKANERIIK